MRLGGGKAWQAANFYCKSAIQTLCVYSVQKESRFLPCSETRGSFATYKRQKNLCFSNLEEGKGIEFHIFQLNWGKKELGTARQIIIRTTGQKVLGRVPLFPTSIKCGKKSEEEPKDKTASKKDRVRQKRTAAGL